MVVRLVRQVRSPTVVDLDQFRASKECFEEHRLLTLGQAAALLNLPGGLGPLHKTHLGRGLPKGYCANRY